MFVGVPVGGTGVCVSVGVALGGKAVKVGVLVDVAVAVGGMDELVDV